METVSFRRMDEGTAAEYALLGKLEHEFVKEKRNATQRYRILKQNATQRNATQRNATIPHSHQKTDGSGKWWATEGSTFLKIILNPVDGSKSDSECGSGKAILVVGTCTYRTACREDRI